MPVPPSGAALKGRARTEQIQKSVQDEEVIVFSAKGLFEVVAVGVGVEVEGGHLPVERVNTSLRDLCKRVLLLEVKAGARQAVAMGIPTWASKGI